MAIITGRDQVLGIYQEAHEKGWVLPCFCSENLTTTEAILAAARRHGESAGIPAMPVILAITCQYSHRSQAAWYTHTRRWDTGLRLFLADLHVLAGPGSPYEDLRVMIHLDHIQFDDDAALLQSDLSGFSSIMYDASRLPLAENIRLTRQFMREQGSVLLVEGACDEIVDAEGNQRSDLTDADKAESYCSGTGVDLIVANLGTEHRASASTLRYHGDVARQIKERIGSRLVLHGASSVPGGQIAGLFADGICKVNIWTILERDSSPVLLRAMLERAVQVAGQPAVAAMKAEGLLGPACSGDGSAALDSFTTVFRQDIVFQAMRDIAGRYFAMWYR